MGRLVDLSGKRFGKWTVQSRGADDIYGKPMWTSFCDCGTRRDVLGLSLRSGKSLNCGCTRIEAMARSISRDGGYSPLRANHPLSAVYNGMWGRCHNPNDKDYERYGGRGIRICDRWRNGEDDVPGFDCFVIDVGPRPSLQHSIDRYPNNDGNYELRNVRWATASEQANNRRIPKR